VKYIGDFAGFFLDINGFITKVSSFLRHRYHIALKNWPTIVALVERFGYQWRWILKKSVTRQLDQRHQVF
jgi:hypothetical protein